jgi:hypothetical protein
VFRHFVCLSILAAVLAPGAFAMASSVDNTELQWALCETSATALVKKLQTSVGPSEVRDVYYLETPGLDLLSQNAFIRIRNTGGKLKSAAKVNYPDDHKLPWDHLHGKDAKCEWDRYGSYKKIGCSLEAKPDDLEESLSKDQEKFLLAETTFKNFEDLTLLGPATSEFWEWHDHTTNADFSLEVVEAPHGFFSMELSTRVQTKEADKIFHTLQTWLNSRGVSLCPVQKGKSEALIRALL